MMMMMMMMMMMRRSRRRKKTVWNGTLACVETKSSRAEEEEESSLGGDQVRFRLRAALIGKQNRPGDKNGSGVVSDVAMTLPNKIREKISGKENEATKVEPFRVLKDVDCCFKAGSMTLVLAPPGHGKTSLLKAIGQVLPSKVLSNGKESRIRR